MTHPDTASDGGYPASCPWCGQQRIHGVCPSNGERHYRCVACGTDFFIHESPRRTAEHALSPSSQPITKRRRFVWPSSTSGDAADAGGIVRRTAR